MVNFINDLFFYIGMTSTIVGKSGNLEYISKNLPDIPIQRIERISSSITDTNELEKEAFQKADSIGYPLIVRSDYSDEAKVGASFAGIFCSKMVKGKSELLTTIEYVRTKDYALEQYCESRNLVLPKKPIDIFFQKYVKSPVRLIITEHPNQENSYFVDINWFSYSFNRKLTGVGLFVQNNNLEHLMYDKNTDFSLKVWDFDFSLKDLVFKNIERVLSDIARIKKLPEYINSGLSYQAEVSATDYSFDQWRPFRKKEFADFRIENIHTEYFIENNIPLDRVFGITEKEGMLFNLKEDFIDVNYVLLDQLGFYQKISPLTLVKDALYLKPLLGHSEFRFYERGSLIAMDLCNLSHDIATHDYARYWSDGYSGLLQFIK